jgi:4-hydroxybenzoate polyprenyltransferase
LKSLLAYLRLTRPANIVTAVADILAGYSISVFVENLFSKWIIPQHQFNLLFLILATIGLYGGGVVMNDVADYKLDKIERPERPIPSGLASRTGAAILGICLLIFGIGCAAMVSCLSGDIAAAIALLALVYDFFGKHHKLLGPVNMGLCRGGNLLLGLSATFSILLVWPLAILPVIYIAAITMISRGEVVGGNKIAISYAGVMYGIVIGGLFFISVFLNHSGSFFEPQLLIASAFILFFSILIFRPLIHAYRNPEPMNIRKAVKAGVLSLIVMDAALSTCFTGWMYGLIILALLPLSILLAKAFAVT